MDTQRLRELLDQRDDIDREISSLVIAAGYSHPPKRAVSCSLCNQHGHTARTCPTKGLKLVPIVPEHTNGHDVE